MSGNHISVSKMRAPKIDSELSGASGNQDGIAFLNFILEFDFIGRIIGSRELIGI